MSGKDAALDQIAALTEVHGITIEEIAAHLGNQRSRARDKGLVAQLLGYLGGIFVFAGIVLLISFIWDDIGSAQRVILTYGTGLAALVLGVVCVRDARFEKAATPLFLVSAFLQPFGLFVFLDEYLPPAGDPELAAMAIFGVLAAQHGLVFWAVTRSSLLFFLLVFWTGFIGTALDLMEWDGELIGVTLGISTLSLSWGIGKTVHAAVTPFWYFIGGAILLAGWWSLTEGTIFDLSTLGLSAFLIYLSIRATSRSLLFVSVIGLLSYLSYFAYEYFADVVGWPIALIALGLAMIGISGWAMKLGRRIGAV